MVLQAPHALADGTTLLILLCFALPGDQSYVRISKVGGLISQLPRAPPDARSALALGPSAHAQFHKHYFIKRMRYHLPERSLLHRTDKLLSCNMPACIFGDRLDTVRWDTAMGLHRIVLVHWIHQHFTHRSIHPLHDQCNNTGNTLVDITLTQ